MRRRVGPASRAGPRVPLDSRHLLPRRRYLGLAANAPSRRARAGHVASWALIGAICPAAAAMAVSASAMCAAAGARPDGHLIPHTTIRRTIAARMVAGFTEAAPVTLTAKIDATNLVGLRAQFKTAASQKNDLVPSYTDVIVKLTAAALRQHPLLQAQWREDGLFVPERIDMAVAVDTEAGLLVPVLRAVDRLTLRQIAARSRELIEQARAGRLAADDMRDATFTVSNLGNFGIDSFTPIIHLPQCAVLGIGRIVREPAVRGDRIIPCDMLTLSLTFDHRVVDGAPTARFLQTLRSYLENPAAWLIS